MAEVSSAYHNLAVVIDGLRSDNVETRITSATKLDYISDGLGPDRTREVRSKQG